jgi:hypothetical protein
LNALEFAIEQLRLVDLSSLELRPIPNTADNVVNFKLFDEDVATDDKISFVDVQTAILPFGEITDV